MRRLALALQLAGVAIWVVGAIAWISGVWVTMPPDVVRALVLSLAVLTGGTLVVSGAVLARASHRADRALKGISEQRAGALGQAPIEMAPRSSRIPDEDRVARS
jgi:hypothetical protein